MEGTETQVDDPGPRRDQGRAADTGPGEGRGERGAGQTVGHVGGLSRGCGSRRGTRVPEPCRARFHHGALPEETAYRLPRREARPLLSSAWPDP
ncbi:hypothetical protein CUD01_19560 [Cellulomonas uda]|uniref:Uncharacterized protein n=1 Tax=Cellulomonas uda TaxID=1714 RepID=A0A4Y3KC43_CELUD|nr:hypothetical protein CUD01_19560 [Cellulomonas uda]